MGDATDIPPWYSYGGRQLAISGAFNVLYSGMLFLTFVWVCVGVVFLIPTAIGAYQIWMGAQAMKGRPQRGVQWISIVGAVVGTLYCQPLSAVAAVIAWTNFSKPEVVGWLENNE